MAQRDDEQQRWRNGRRIAGAVAVVLSLLSSTLQAAEPVRTVGLLRPVVEGQPVRGYPVELTAPGAVVGMPPPGAVSTPQTSCPSEPPPACDADRPAWTLFDFRTQSGGCFSVFPSTLLWEPPLAGKDQPRLQLLQTNLSDSTSQNTLDGIVGGIAGMFRYEGANKKWAIQWDAFAVVSLRISEYDYMIANDFRAGLPITFRYGNWSGKFGYEHTSTHMGDDLIVNNGRQPILSVKDELVVGLDHWCWDQLRLYGEFAYAFSQYSSVDADPIRFGTGFEWRSRKPTGVVGRPYAAAQVNFSGDQDYDPNVVVQIGWMWRKPSQRLASFRIFGEYYSGKAPFGQLFLEPNQFFAIGMAIDY